MSYKQLTKILGNEEILSSFSQNSSGKTHQWKGIINQDYFDLTESGAKNASFDKIADKIAQRFGINESIKEEENAKQLKWALFTWNPVRQVLLLGDSLFIDVEEETEGSVTVACKRKVRSAANERLEPELFLKHTGPNYPEAEHVLACKVLKSPEYLDRYQNECEIQTMKKTNNIDQLPDLGWSLYEDVSDDDGEVGEDGIDYIQKLTDYCEALELQGPEFKKNQQNRPDSTHHTMCLVTIKATGKTEDEACNNLMANTKKVLEHGGNKDFYECLRPKVEKKEEASKEETKEETTPEVKEEEMETSKEVESQDNEDDEEEPEDEADEPEQVETKAPSSAKRGRRGRGRGKK